MRTFVIALAWTVLTAAGQAVSLHTLEAAFPDLLGMFKASESMREMSVPMVAARRQYRNGTRQLTVDIIDTSSGMLAAALRAPFAPGSSPNRSSSEAVQRTLMIGKYPGVLTWNRTDNASLVQILVDNRFVVRLMIFPASNPEESVTVVRLLKLSAAVTNEKTVTPLKTAKFNVPLALITRGGVR